MKEHSGIITEKNIGMDSKPSKIKVGGLTFSTFKAEFLAGCNIGDSVKVQYEENPGKNAAGVPVVYKNLKNIFKVDLSQVVNPFNSSDEVERKHWTTDYVAWADITVHQLVEKLKEAQKALADTGEGFIFATQPFYSGRDAGKIDCIVFVKKKPQ